MDDYTTVDAYLDASTRWPGEIRALRPVLVSSGLDEQIKWGKPCYCHGDANVALVQEFSDHLGLMFFKGVLLADAEGLLHDHGPYTHGPKRMRFTSVAEVEQHASAIAAYLREAVALEEAGAELPERPDETLAVELAERLASDDELAAAFDDLTPGRQREYNLHVLGAKQVSTRERRVDRIIGRILAGKGLRDR